MTVLADDLAKHLARRKSAKVNQHTPTSMRDIFDRANNATLNSQPAYAPFTVIRGKQSYRPQRYQTGMFLGEVAVKNNRATVVLTDSKVWRLFPNDDAKYLMDSFGGNSA